MLHQCTWPTMWQQHTPRTVQQLLVLLLLIFWGKICEAQRACNGSLTNSVCCRGCNSSNCSSSSNRSSSPLHSSTLHRSRYFVYYPFSSNKRLLQRKRWQHVLPSKDERERLKPQYADRSTLPIIRDQGRDHACCALRSTVQFSATSFTPTAIRPCTSLFCSTDASSSQHIADAPAAPSAPTGAGGLSPLPPASAPAAAALVAAPHPILLSSPALPAQASAASAGPAPATAAAATETVAVATGVPTLKRAKTRRGACICRSDRDISSARSWDRLCFSSGILAGSDVHVSPSFLDVSVYRPPVLFAPTHNLCCSCSSSGSSSKKYRPTYSNSRSQIELAVPRVNSNSGGVVAFPSVACATASSSSSSLCSLAAAALPPATRGSSSSSITDEQPLHRTWRPATFSVDKWLLLFLSHRIGQSTHTPLRTHFSQVWGSSSLTSNCSTGRCSNSNVGRSLGSASIYCREGRPLLNSSADSSSRGVSYSGSRNSSNSSSNVYSISSSSSGCMSGSSNSSTSSSGVEELKDKHTENRTTIKTVACPVDLFEMLGVTPESNVEEIGTGYQQAIKQLNTVGNIGCPGLSNMIEAAYTVLRDDTLRTAYVATGRIPEIFLSSFEAVKALVPPPSTRPTTSTKDGVAAADIMIGPVTSRRYSTQHKKGYEKLAGTSEPTDAEKNGVATSAAAIGGDAEEDTQVALEGEEGEASEGENTIAADEEEEQHQNTERRRGPLGQLGGVLSSLLGGRLGGGGGRSTSRPPQPGDDVWADLQLLLSEVACTSVQKEINVSVMRRCSSCRGTGAAGGARPLQCDACSGQGAITKVKRMPMGVLQSSRTCSSCGGTGMQPLEACTHCNGDGRTRVEEAIQVAIPAGVADGATLTLRGRGDAGVAGGKPGDLLLNVEVTNDTPFRREGNNLLSIAKISYPDAVLGLPQKDVHVIDGKAKISIKPGTHSGDKIVIKGRGTVNATAMAEQQNENETPEQITSPSTPKRGDHIVVVEIEVPTTVSDGERRLLEQLKEIDPPVPRN